MKKVANIMNRNVSKVFSFMRKYNKIYEFANAFSQFSHDL